MKKNKLWNWKIMLCMIALGTIVYYSCSGDENEYHQVPHSEIKDWEKGKGDWSNKDSSVLVYSLFKDLRFLSHYSTMP